jgi:hypothetical protein
MAWGHLGKEEEEEAVAESELKVCVVVSNL